LNRGDLTEAQWRILDRLLPDRGERAPPIADKRRTVNGILWVLRTGAPWRMNPDEPRAPLLCASARDYVALPCALLSAGLASELRYASMAAAVRFVSPSQCLGPKDR